MQVRKIGYIQLFNAIKERLSVSGYPVLDAVPVNQPSPFVLVEFVGRMPDNSKNWWRENISIWIHCIAEVDRRNEDSRENVLRMTHKIEEAMTHKIDLGECVEVVEQGQNGTFNIQQDETKEWHSVVGFDIKVVYGMRAKVFRKGVFR